MAALAPAARDAFRADYGAAMQACRAGVVPPRAKHRDATWFRWTQYCDGLGVDPMLSNVADPTIVLQVFAARYRSGELAPSGQITRSRTVEAALRAIGQTMASMGASDPRYTAQGHFQYRLQQQLRGYARLDAPPSRVKPLPFTVVCHAYQNAITTLDFALADLAIIGFYFLLRPGEHTHSNAANDTHPFRLCDVTFRIGALTVTADIRPLDLIPYATFATLTFTKQKNGVENEIVGHARSGHASVCPVLALIRRTLHLRQYQAPRDAPLCTV